MSVPTAPDEPLPRPGLRQRKKERTKAAMMDVALRLFGERGYEAVTVQDIADAAEVSATTFFRYFATKEDVIFADRGHVLPVLEQAASDAGEPIDELDVVRLAIIAAVGEYDDIDQLRRRLQVVARSDSLRGRANEMEQLWRESIAHGATQRPGLRATARDIDIAVRVGVALWSGALDVWTAPEESEPSRERLLSLLDEWYDAFRFDCARWARHC